MTWHDLTLGTSFFIDGENFFVVVERSVYGDSVTLTCLFANKLAYFVISKHEFLAWEKL